MRVLLNISDLNIGTSPAEEMEEDIVGLLRALYESSTDDDEAYLRDGLYNLVLGRDTPEKLLEEVRGWNDRLREDLETAISHLTERKEREGRWLVDDQSTYMLKKAAMAIDDDLYAYSDYAVAKPIEESPKYLQVVVEDKGLEYIKEHPEEFAIADIAVK